MTSPFLAGLAVAAAALAGKYSIQAWQAYKVRPVVPRMRRFYEGGFQQTMTRREAALILGVRRNSDGHEDCQEVSVEPRNKIVCKERLRMVTRLSKGGGWKLRRLTCMKNQATAREAQVVMHQR
ncbi:mitochondrial import inner membrane translocase subunit TIM14-3-like isoform X1 [Iris pallida]|uniref:Mitochondrial import inner membrane translocase subunit TIM14-3-like isoform X1 n=1 Tax=Iris pallida TaxID=29817 RepID=A0AAX6E400_IRIPA|nr:mitochondrial import inner membrane translocase subunit TIM14-3-like isoform X1 [Iris pallida]